MILIQFATVMKNQADKTNFSYFVLLKRASIQDLKIEQ